MNKLVSIITPCYNSEKYIDKTINSVLDQTYTDWEMIIVDDVSTDNSIKIIKRHQNKDIRIKYIRLANNSGAAVCRNTAIEQANGRYIAFLDSDDLWIPGKLQKQIDFMNVNNIALSFASYKKIDEEGNIIPDSDVYARDQVSYHDMMTSNKIGCLTAIYDTQQLGKVYMPLIKKRQDYALWLKILKTTSFAYGYQESLGFYRVRNSSVSSQKVEMLKWNWKMFRNIEKMSILKTFYCVFMNVLYKILK
tara:strand:+ start:56181 stop:56927 length:747 start_codon:yes stop_codon:yes gene_type:complete